MLLADCFVECRAASQPGCPVPLHRKLNRPCSNARLVPCPPIRNRELILDLLRESPREPGFSIWKFSVTSYDTVLSNFPRRFESLEVRYDSKGGVSAAYLDPESIDRRWANSNEVRNGVTDVG